MPDLQQLPWRITADDPALSVMTDLCQRPPSPLRRCPARPGIDTRSSGRTFRWSSMPDDHILGLVTSRDIDAKKPPDFSPILRPARTVRLRRRDRGRNWKC